MPITADPSILSRGPRHQGVIGRRGLFCKSGSGIDPSPIIQEGNPVSSATSLISHNEMGARLCHSSGMSTIGMDPLQHTDLLLRSPPRPPCAPWPRSHLELRWVSWQALLTRAATLNSRAISVLRMPPRAFALALVGRSRTPSDFYVVRKYGAVHASAAVCLSANFQAVRPNVAAEDDIPGRVALPCVRAFAARRDCSVGER